MGSTCESNGRCLHKPLAALNGMEPIVLPVYGAPSAAELDVLLEAPMRDVPELLLLLRRQHFQVDAANDYTLWFLHHTRVPHSVHSYDAQTWATWSNRENYVMATTASQLRANAGRFITRAGVFFFIIMEEQENEQKRGRVEERQQLEQSFRQLWTQQKIYNTYILTDDGVWHYDPFAEEEQQRGRLVRYVGSQPLQRLLFRNMRGYPLRVQIFKSVYARPEIDAATGNIERVTGADALVAELLSERLNFTMVLQQPDRNYFGERSANGSYNGAIGSIIADGLDICLTGFFVKDYMVDEYMDFTVAVYDDELCIYVPKAMRIPQSIVPIFAVGYDIWSGFILSAFACAIIWMMFRLVNLHLGIVKAKGRRLWRQALRIVVDTWVVWVRVNLSQFPSSYSERIFIASLCLVSVIFGAIFESSLATVYIHPMHYKDINTLQELDESGLKVVYKYTSMADDLFFSETSPLFASLNKKLWWNRDLYADVIHQVATYGGKAGVSRYSSLILESTHFLLSGRVWVIPECPKYYTISYVLPKDAPWSDAVDALLLRMLNAGLIKKWIDDMKTEVDIAMHGKTHESTDEGSTFRVLTIGDLQLAFYVVLCGNLFAGLGFLAERGWARWDQKQATKHNQ
ncbi:uncharacterized protein LOC115627675 [Scaptodrosophila lebanonensis]|uniref:Uncharacterized protein LOC115627675 n=1 Tax=Drosophila lebanonensis TaxID=7225 RepID=A0A6J2TWL8_DROLE|nr:uncharacterized protein LOC115627675 [Scaptodrosophila lebanonensis]